MKKGFISFIIILLFAGFIFYLGFVSFRVPVGKYGVMTSKTSGVYQKIIENENLSEDVISETRGRTNINKFENEVAFARNYLVYGGYIDNSERGVWKLTEQGFVVDMTKELASEIFRQNIKRIRQKDGKEGKDNLGDITTDTTQYWIYSPGKDACKCSGTPQGLF